MSSSSSNAKKPGSSAGSGPGPSSSAAPGPPATTSATATTTYPLTSSSLPKDHRLHIARFTTPKPLIFEEHLTSPITLSRRELRDLPRALPQSVIDAQAKAAAAAAAAAEQSAEQAAAEAKASGMGMAAAALGKASAADDNKAGRDGAEQKKYPVKKEKQVADPSKIAPYGGARVVAAGADDDGADPAATPTPAAASAAAPKSSAFQKRTREIRMVDDAVRLARREEITPWVLHGADPGASEKAARRLKRRTMRKMLVAAGKVKEAERLESSEEEEEAEEEVKEEEKKDEQEHEDKMDVDAKPEEGVAAGAAVATGPKWKRKNDKEKFRYRVPEPNERVFLGAREDPQSEYFLFIHDTEPVPGITKGSTTHFKVTPVSNWFKFAERNLRAPTITADQAEELIKLKRSRRAAPPTSAAAKLLHRLNQADSAPGDADGGGAAGSSSRVSTKRAGGGGKDWGDVDELDFDLTEQFADDEEDVVGDLEDENEGFKSQIKQMFALGLGGEAMDEDFDEDFLVEDTAGAAKGGTSAAGAGGAGAGAKGEGKQLSSGGRQMIKLLRSQGYESEDDDDEWFGSDEEGEDGEAEAAASQGVGEGQASPAANGGAKPSDVVMRALAAAATAKAKSAAAAAGNGGAKRSASAANLDSAPKNGSGGQNPNPPVPPFSRDEIRATLRSRGPLTAGQLIQALPRGQEQIAVYGKEAFVEVLKASMVQKDANKKLHLRQ